MGEPRVYTVAEIQREVRFLLESEFGGIWVEGEISGHRHHHSGHHYFTLKDADAQLSAVLWRSSARRIRFELEDGLAVRARGRLSLYEVRGQYQMIVDALEPVGTGPLQVKFEQMRKRLEADGLFDPDRKKPLPAFPRRAALVTSPTGAAVRDLIAVAGRRWPLLELVVFPVRVQGPGAADEIAAAVGLADECGFDLIVVGRGGGSPEDLWAFNEEVVARAIFSAETPVVSAVGHEVDLSISDLTADVRAATPSVAAETMTPSAVELVAWLDVRRRRLGRALVRKVDELRARLAAVEASSVFRRPLDPVRRAEQQVDDGADRLVRAFKVCLGERRSRLEVLAGRLDALSPLKVLARGYSVTRKAGRVLTRAADASAGDELETRLADGEIRSRVL